MTEPEANQEANQGESPRKIRFNQQNLYREETFSDLTVGSIRQMMPVKPNGEPDKTRSPLFVGQSQVYTQQGPMPIQFPIDAKNLPQAMEKFQEAMEAFVAHLVEQAKEMQRQEQSRIIVPGASPAGESSILMK
jgi:hypothetical protein